MQIKARTPCFAQQSCKINPMQTLDKLDRQILLVPNRAHYSCFIMITLLKHASVQDCKSSFVLDRVKSATAVPL